MLTCACACAHTHTNWSNKQEEIIQRLVCLSFFTHPRSSVVSLWPALHPARLQGNSNMQSLNSWPYSFILILRFHNFLTLLHFLSLILMPRFKLFFDLCITLLNSATLLESLSYP